MSEGQTYQVLLESAAQKQLRGFDPQWRRRILAKLEELGHRPRGTDSVKLAGGDDMYRVRVGDVRIVYAIRDERLLVLVVRIAKRDEVYKR